jgi:hypothetical protein
MKEAAMPDSSRPLLVRRERCPACQRSSSRTLYREALDSPGISRYMRDHYARRVNTEQVFEHLLEPGDMLRSLAGALRPGGLVKISVPDCAKSIRKLLGSRDFGALSAGDIMPIAPFEHVNAFTCASLSALGRKAGLLPLRPSLRKLYNASSGWMQPKSALRSLMRPAYRHLYPKSSFVDFSRAA